MWTLPVDRLGRLEWWRLKDATPKIKGSVYDPLFILQYYVGETKELQFCDASRTDDVSYRIGYGSNKKITIVDVVYRYQERDYDGDVKSITIPAGEVERVLPELKLVRVPTDNGLSELTEKMKQQSDCLAQKMEEKRLQQTAELKKQNDQLTAEMKKQHEQTTKSLAELRDLVIELMAKVSWKEDLNKETTL